jgi:aspartokinase-like uncharacterized kinase
MWVVKLGGSLLGSPALKRWLDALNSFSDGKVVIVPGGGLFADAVRESQLMTGIDDATAHKMAVVAMDQYATLMCGLNPSLTLASTLTSFLGSASLGLRSTSFSSGKLLPEISSSSGYSNTMPSFVSVAIYISPYARV